jgi:hypothetical protein
MLTNLGLTESRVRLFVSYCRLKDESTTLIYTYTDSIDEVEVGRAPADRYVDLFIEYVP